MISLAQTWNISVGRNMEVKEIYLYSQVLGKGGRAHSESQTEDA